MLRKLFRVGIPALLGALLGAAVLCIAVTARSSEPIVLRQPQEAVDCARRMLQAVCDGDFEAASAEFYGAPQLAALPDDPLTRLVWERYCSSLRYTLPPDAQCHISHDGVTLDVQMHTLSLDTLTDGLRTRFEARLAQRIADAQDTRELYDAQGAYLSSVIDEVLQEVLSERLREVDASTTQTVTLAFVYAQERWWVQPTGQVLDILSGKAGW